jgi:hypothetical protein
MKAFFAGKDLNAIRQAIEDAMKGRKLGQLTRMSVVGTRLEATISKMGTSTLVFSSLQRDGGTEVTLTEERLALTHRPLRGEVKEKLSHVVEQAGGTVLIKA